MALKFEVSISGVFTDRSGYVDPTSIRVQRGVKTAMDQLAVTLRAVPATLEPIVLQPVRLRDDATGDLYFAGVLVEVQGQESANEATSPLPMNYALTCAGWTFDLDRHLIREARPEEAAGVRVRHFINNVVNVGRPVGEQFTATTATVPNGPTVPADAFDETTSPALDRVAQAVDFDWWTDFSRVVYFQPRAGTGAAAPWVVDSTASFRHPLKLVSGIQVRNHVEVIGGTVVLPADGSDFIFNFLGNGTQEHFKLSDQQIIPGTLTFYRNDSGAINEGTDGRTVGNEEKGDKATDFQWLVNYTAGKLLRGTDTIPPSGANLRAKFKYTVTAIAQDEDSDSIALYGRYDHIIRDPAIQSTQLAQALATRELAIMSQPQIAFSLSTNETGLRPGQLLTINLPEYGLDTRKTIRTVTETIVSPSTGPLTLLNYLWHFDVEAA